MSVTFQITNSPMAKSQYSECLCVYNGTPSPDCCYCSGTGDDGYEEPSWPWINMSNVNAIDVLCVIGMSHSHDNLCGEWETKAIDLAIKGCLKALNIGSRRAMALREDEGYTGKLGAKAYICGSTDEQVTRRIRDLLAVCKKAREENEKVYFG